MKETVLFIIVFLALTFFGKETDLMSKSLIITLLAMIYLKK